MPSTVLSLELLGPIGFVVFTGFSVFFGLLMRGSIRLGREWDEMKADRDFWRSRAERGTRLAETATSVAERSLPSARD